MTAVQDFADAERELRRLLAAHGVTVLLGNLTLTSDRPGFTAFGGL